MREEKHFPKTLHIIFYYLSLCSVASPGRQAGPVQPPCSTGAVSLGTPVLLLLLVSDHRCHLCTARRQSNLKEKRRRTRGPSTHSCPGADQTGHLGGAPWPGAQSGPLRSPQLPVRVTAEQVQKDQAGGNQCSGPCLGVLCIKAPVPRPGEGRTGTHGRGQAAGHQGQWSSGPPRDQQCAASVPPGPSAALLSIQP